MKEKKRKVYEFGLKVYTVARRFLVFFKRKETWAILTLRSGEKLVYRNICRIEAHGERFSLVFKVPGGYQRVTWNWDDVFTLEDMRALPEEPLTQADILSAYGQGKG